MIYALILAGGKGTRLYPLSRANQPKQFLKVINNKSFLVNMKQINVIHNDKIILTDNSSVLLSKSRRAEVRKLYFRGGA